MLDWFEVSDFARDRGETADGGLRQDAVFVVAICGPLLLAVAGAVATRWLLLLGVPLAFFCACVRPGAGTRTVDSRGAVPLALAVIRFSVVAGASVAVIVVVLAPIPVWFAGLIQVVACGLCLAWGWSTSALQSALRGTS